MLWRLAIVSYLLSSCVTAMESYSHGCFRDCQHIVNEVFFLCFSPLPFLSTVLMTSMQVMGEGKNKYNVKTRCVALIVR